MLKYAFGNYDKFHIIRFLSAPNWHLRPLSPMAVEQKDDDKRELEAQLHVEYDLSFQEYEEQEESNDSSLEQVNTNNNTITNNDNNNNNNGNDDEDDNINTDTVFRPLPPSTSTLSSSFS